MACESWKAKLDTYLDGELPSEEMRAFDVHGAKLPYLRRECSRAGTDDAQRSDYRKAFYSRFQHHAFLFRTPSSS